MYDIVYDFITNEFLATTQELNGLNYILTDVSMVLMYVALVMFLIWVVNIAKGILHV